MFTALGLTATPRRAGPFAVPAQVIPPPPGTSEPARTIPRRFPEIIQVQTFQENPVADLVPYIAWTDEDLRSGEPVIPFPRKHYGRSAHVRRQVRERFRSPHK